MKKTSLFGKVSQPGLTNRDNPENNPAVQDLDEHYGALDHAQHDHDAMHRAGLVDKHLRNPRRKGFTEKWLNDLIENVSQVFEVLNKLSFAWISLVVLFGWFGFLY